MPKVDPIFIIGVIREKEKGFLQPDEYLRLIENIRALRDTPYGQALPAEISLATADAAIQHHLKEELTWLAQYLDNQRILECITARYDAMNIVSALLQKQRGNQSLTLPSPLGSIPQDALFAAIWDTNGKSLGQAAWAEVIGEETEAMQKDGWHASQLLGRMSGHLVNVLETVAFTPLTKQIAAIASHHSSVDSALRLETKQTTVEIASQLKGWGHGHVSEAIINQVKNRISATEYELAWDKELMAVISPYRFHVSGYDPIIAYWVAKQIESQNVRLIIAGKLASLPKETIVSFSRPYYQPKFT